MCAGFHCQREEELRGEEEKKWRQKDEEGEKSMENREDFIQHLGHCILKALFSNSFHPC